MLDLAAFKRRHVTAWGDRMTVGVQVAELRELVEELESLRERHQIQTATLDGVVAARLYWERMARAAYAESARYKLELDDLRTRFSEPPPPEEGT